MLVATYFHYRELHERWPERAKRARFAAIYPDSAVVAALPEGRDTVLACELEAVMAANVAADVRGLLRGVANVEPLVVGTPGDGLAGTGDAPILFSPRVWAPLSDAERDDPRALLVRYVFGERDLECLRDLEPAATGSLSVPA